MSSQTRKTKIICTIGPASSSKDQLKSLVDRGMDVARLNFSHGDHESHGRVLGMLRRLSEKSGKALGVLQDLAGPKVRIGSFPEGSVELQSGSEFVLTTRDVEGSTREVSVDYDGLPDEVEVDDRILLADGAIELSVDRIRRPDIHCHVVYGGQLGSRKGVNCPSGLFGLPILDEKDLSDLSFGLGHGVEYVGLSFVRSAEDVRRAREEVQRRGDALIIAKVETQAALDHFDEILAEADGVMIARGDLSIETPFSRVPVLQKQLITKANRAAKPVITATQMLYSMVNAPRPTRAEVADVANAVMDGSDAVMLSEETAVGQDPVRAVEVMDRIVRDTEGGGLKVGWEQELPGEDLTAGDREAMALAACRLADDLGVDYIGTITRTGRMARLAAKFRPHQPILASTPDPETFRRLALVRGVVPLLLPRDLNEYEDMAEAAVGLAHGSGWAGRSSVLLSENFVRRGRA
jgi:pyruvate kinase